MKQAIILPQFYCTLSYLALPSDGLGLNMSVQTFPHSYGNTTAILCELQAYTFKPRQPLGTD